MVAAYLLLPTLLKPCAGASSAPKKLDVIFFDERFLQARRLVASWLETADLTAVHGDVTPFWCDGLDRVSTEHPLRLRGVTTDSFQFCLRILLSEHADVEVQVSRLDQDLFVWAMSTIPKSNNGSAPWQSLSHRV